ncbi:MAG: PDZ domain-containing protein [Candidatus Neomarinimicrobiota bacterium]
MLTNKYGLYTMIMSLSLLLIPAQIMSQNGELEEIEKNADILNEKAQKLSETAEKLHLKFESPFENGFSALNHNMSDEYNAKLGLYLDDINFEEAYEKHYPENYGVLVSGVISGGNAKRAGLLRGDIIMEFDGEKVRFEEHLMNLRDGKKIGDVVEIVYFRNEKVFKTSLTFSPEIEDEDLEIGEKSLKSIKEKKLSPGFGGGGPYVTTIKYDFSSINNFLTANGFGKITSSNLITFGGGGSGNVGNGWFIGGHGGGMEMKEQIQVGEVGSGSSRKYQLDMAYGGVTITKKQAIYSKRFVLDAGILLGGGSMDLTLHQTGGNYLWDAAIDDSDNYSVNYRKDFFVYRPSVGLMVRIKNWMAIHGSVGYFGSYATTDDWSDEYFNFSVRPGTNKSPQIPNDISYSLGFWFGF